jgi:hypothetical protein
VKYRKSAIFSALAGVRQSFGVYSFPQRVSVPWGPEISVPLTPGTLKKGESMNAVLAIATAVLAVVAVLEYIRRQAK